MTLWKLHKRGGAIDIVDDAEKMRRDRLKRPGYVHFEKAQIHQCSHCGKMDAWRESWGWYGSIEQIDNWEGEQPVIPKWCGEDCRKALIAARRVPRNMQRMDNEE